MNTTSPPPQTPSHMPSTDGVRIGGNADVGGDLASRDIVKTTAYVGFCPQAVQRLLITVGVLVFITAACFFSGGVVVGGAAIAALYRPVNSENLSAALALQSEIDHLKSLPAGERFHISMSEEAMSSYVNLILGPQIGLRQGKVRLIEEGSKVIVGGRLAEVGDLPIAVVFSAQYGVPAAPLRLAAAAVQVLPLGESRFGWVVVPTTLLEPLAQALNKSLGNNYALTNTTMMRGELGIDGVVR